MSALHKYDGADSPFARLGGEPEAIARLRAGTSTPSSSKALKIQLETDGRAAAPDIC